MSRGFDTYLVYRIVGEGVHTGSYLAIDNVNNPEATNSLPIKIDKTPPTITAVPSPLPNANGWNENRRKLLNV